MMPSTAPPSSFPGISDRVPVLRGHGFTLTEKRAVVRRGTASQPAEKRAVVKGHGFHSLRKNNKPQIQGRPGSPHSKKLAPPPAQHQRKSSAAPPQSTAVFHFGRRAIREMTDAAPQAWIHHLAEKTTPPQNTGQARFTPQQEVCSTSGPASTQIVSGPTPKYCRVSFWEEGDSGDDRRGPAGLDAPPCGKNDTPQNTGQARFTPQQEACSTSGPASTQIVSGPTPKYCRVSFWEEGDSGDDRRGPAGLDAPPCGKNDTPQNTGQARFTP